ncbi:MAG: YhfC family intramembrane metalloprotease [Cohnella sp.]|nr:YhfC family intramembrane metalloprotease [Cohnella sp.]
MTTETIQPNDELWNRAVKRGLICLPLYILVPALFWLGFELAGYGMDWKGFGLGALGWFIALALRGPIGAAGMKLSQNAAKNLMIASSGVLEETVRLILIALTSATASWSLSVGQGWAAIEVLYTMITVVAIASLAKKTDEKSLQAKQMLEAQGTVQASPLWGILERIWASAFHIGSTLVVAKYPWAVIALIPVHSGLNWFGVKLAARALWQSSVFIGCLGACMLAIGLAL